MSDPVLLSAAGVSKRFCRDLRRSLGYGVRDIARDMLGRWERPRGLRPGEFWALEDISFELRRGDTLAIVGANGAGKSTLLKILAGIMKPDRGEVRRAGSLQAIIEMSSGFSPLLSGRENIALGATMRGIAPRRMGALAEAVEDFAGLDGFLDAPFQSYSSGMKARLAFALAAGLDPDVLLVDEALAVGDLNFQRKCVNYIQGYVERGGALVFISHSTYQIQWVCQRGILLDQGRIGFAGSAVETLAAMFERAREATLLSGREPSADGLIAGVGAHPIDGDEPRTGAPLRIVLTYRPPPQPRQASWSFSIWTADGTVCVTAVVDSGSRTMRPGGGTFECMIPKLPLIGGSYLIRATLLEPGSTLPFAVFGKATGGTPLNVGSRPDPVTNARLRTGQLVEIEAVFL